MKIGKLYRVSASTSLIAIAAMGGPAFAQGQQAQEEQVVQGVESESEADSKGDVVADSEGNTIVVRGTRASLASALDRRRNADTVSDSIVAEDVSNFPDKNIGEAVARAPGVQLTRDFGEGAQISIRGTAPELNRVEINGMSALSSSGTNSRATDFREFASELVKTVDIFKGTTADMVEGGVGGTVRVELRRPLDFKDLMVVGNAAMQHQNTRGDWSPRLNLTAAKNWNDTFGLLVNVTYDDVKTRGDLARNTEWVRLDDFDNSPERTVIDPNFANVSTQADCNGDRTCLRQWFDYSPRIPRYSLWTRDDERLSAQVTAQWRPSDRLDLTVDYNYNQRALFLTDFNYVTQLTSTGRFARDGDGNYLVDVDENHNVVGATYRNVDRMFNTEQRAFNLDIESQYASLRADWDVTDTLQGRFMVGMADNEYLRRTNRAMYAARLDGLRVEIDRQNGIPNIIFPEGFDQGDPNNYNYLQLDWRPGIENQDEFVMSGDFDWEIEDSFFRSIEFGARYTEYGSQSYGGGGYLDPDTGEFVPTLDITHRSWRRDSRSPASLERLANNTTGTLSVWRYYDGSELINAVSETAINVGEFFPNINIDAPLPTNWLAPDYNAVANYIVQTGQFAGQPMFDTTNFDLDQSIVTNVNGQSFNQLPLDLKEDVLAGYLKGNFEGEFLGIPFTGNAGVRVVRTQSAATGVLETRIRIEDDDSTDDSPQSTINVIGSDNSTIRRTYTEFLPSVNANFVLVPERVYMRLGASQNLSRPPINDLRPSGSCTFLDPGLTLSRFPDTVDSCSAGNPALQPFKSWNFDAEVAWYPTREAEVRLGFFYKDISSYVVGRATIDDVDFFGDGRSIRVTQPINGEGANNYGLEFSAQTPFTFLPAPFDGFGAQVNYTYSDASEVGLFSQLDGAELPQIGKSKPSLGLGGSYDQGPLNVRFAYN